MVVRSNTAVLVILLLRLGMFSMVVYIKVLFVLVANVNLTRYRTTSVCVLKHLFNISDIRNLP